LGQCAEMSLERQSRPPEFALTVYRASIAVTIGRVTSDEASIFTRLAPVLNVRDLTAERRFCESLGPLRYLRGRGVPSLHRLRRRVDYDVQRCQPVRVGVTYVHENGRLQLVTAECLSLRPTDA